MYWRSARAKRRALDCDASFCLVNGWRLDIGELACLDLNKVICFLSLLAHSVLASCRRFSIHYTRLPSLFIAFDLYDRLTQKFLARPILASLLRCIPLVPELARLSTLPSPTALAEMAQNTPSAFYDGPIEGVYVKQEDGANVVARGKIVRKGFIAGNEHWTRGVFTWNVVVGNTKHT